MSVYLDYNATAKVRPEAIAAMTRALEAGGNPSCLLSHAHFGNRSPPGSQPSIIGDLSQ